MNKDLVLKLRNQAIDNVSNKRKLSDGQIERSWNPDDLDIEFAGLVAKQCAILAMHQHMSKSPDHYSDLDEYDKGCDDTASSIASSIRFYFGIKDEVQVSNEMEGLADYIAHEMYDQMSYGM